MTKHWRYQFLINIASLPIALLSLWQAIRYKDLKCLQQRFGFGFRKISGNPLWVHAASVGEVIAVSPLIVALRQQQADLPIVLTTVTPTGKLVALQRLAREVSHVYLPLDSNIVVKRFYDRIQPCCLLIMETEIWPNLFKQSTSLNIPLVIINGRLSRRTLNTKPWIKQLYATTLKHPRAILARSPQDAKHYVALGADAENTRIIGNIKFAAINDISKEIPERIVDRPYVLFASTHDNEELRITKLWQKLARTDILLVIAPRHPYRTSKIINQLKEITTNISIRSKQQTITATTQIYLADTVGELIAFMAHAELVFMGGSLVPVGGHNILEPAMLGKAIIYGPHMQNFTDESAQFLAHNAAIQIQDEQALKEVLQQLLTSRDNLEELGNNARQLMAKNTDIIERYIEAIGDYCPRLRH